MKGEKNLFTSKIFCIDASALLDLMPHWKKDTYRRDVFPTIWKKMEDLIESGELISPIEVYKEIEDREDEIYAWCKQNKRMFRDVDNCQLQKIKLIEVQYDHKYWNQEHLKKPWADPLVIALSICEKAIIVTDEKKTPNRIPFIAEKFSIRCLGLVDFFKEIGVLY